MLARTTEKATNMRSSIVARLLITALVSMPLLVRADTAQDVFNRVNQSIVAVFTQAGNKPTGAFGSGVVIGPGQVVTACHVIGQNAGLWVHHHGNYYRAESSASDPRRDLCLIQVSGLRAPAVKLGTSNSLTRGQPIWSLGAPKSLDEVIGAGIVAGLYSIQGANIIKVTTPVYKGSGGAGLFNANAELVGIVTATTKSGANIQFAMPADWIKTVGQNQSRYGFQPPRSLLDDTVNIEAGNIDSSRVMTATNVDQEFFATTPKQERDRRDKAQRLLDARNWTALRELAEQWCAGQPSSTEAWMFLGHAAVGMQEPEAMESAFGHVVKLDPENAIAHYYLGNAYVFQGKSQLALVEYQRAQAIQPSDHVYKDAADWTSKKLENRQKTGAAKASIEKSAAREVPAPPAIAQAPAKPQTKAAPGFGRGLLVFAILFILCGLGVYIMFLINSAQRWGTAYPQEYRRGALILSGVAALALFVPLYWIFF